MLDQVKLKKKGRGSYVVFDFLGKDSVRFHKELLAPPLIFKNFEEFLTGRAPSSQVFSRISAASINDYLKQFDKSFTNKVFRTRLASGLMYNALKKIKIPEGANKKETKLLFNKASKKVAEVLNHTRTVSKKAQESVKRLKSDLKALKAARRAASTDKERAKLDKKIATKSADIEAKQDTQNVSINTSLTNYIDPRIVVSWALKQKGGKKRGLEILNHVYNPAMVRKFQWAIQSTPKTWNWATSSLAAPLEPARPKAPRVSSRKPLASAAGSRTLQAKR